MGRKVSVSCYYLSMGANNKSLTKGDVLEQMFSGKLADKKSNLWEYLNLVLLKNVLKKVSDKEKALVIKMMNEGEIDSLIALINNKFPQVWKEVSEDIKTFSNKILDDVR